MARTALRLSDLPLLLRMTGVLAVMAVGSRRLPLPRLARLLEGTPRRQQTHDAADVNRLVWLTQGLLLRVYKRDFCFPRSFVLFHFLSRWGYPVRLCFGIRRDDHRLAGHAWVELDEEPFAETEDPRVHYHTTFTYPPTQTERRSPDEPRYQGQHAAQAFRRAEAGAAREAA